MPILIIEDDRSISLEIQHVLSDAGFISDIVRDGIKGTNQALNNAYDAIILDVMLPLKDGISVCKDLRDQQITTPILMLTARTEMDFCLRALSAGADDFMKKPFNQDELLARLRAVTRRHQTTVSSSITFGDIEVDTENYTITCSKQSERLTKTELRLITHLVTVANTVVDKKKLIHHVWGSSSGHSENHLAVYIKHLRNKLEQLDSKIAIVNIHGIGYSMKWKS